jgi:Uma2 family endonuclease
MAAISHASSVSRPDARLDDEPRDHDQRVILRGMSWKDFEILLALRGDRAGVRAYYLEGEIELMSPSGGHEGLKTMLARLLEAWADERGLELNGYGSWTLKSDPNEVGAEPDECYVVDAVSKELPDLAIEVIWTRGGLRKLDIYRGLGVREVWMLDREHVIQVHALRGDRYELIARSEVLPALDLVWLASFLANESQSQAVRALRAAMRAP